MITIYVLGVPIPGGSKSVFLNRKTRKIIVAPANKKTAGWRQQVAIAAREQYSGELIASAVNARYSFRLPRPKSHFGTGKNSAKLKVDAPYWHISKPDLTKLIRSTEDALTGIIWHDDSQSCLGASGKRYCNSGELPGVEIHIEELF